MSLKVNGDDKYRLSVCGLAVRVNDVVPVKVIHPPVIALPAMLDYGLLTYGMSTVPVNRPPVRA